MHGGQVKRGRGRHQAWQCNLVCPDSAHEASNLLSSFELAGTLDLTCSSLKFKAAPLAAPPQRYRRDLRKTIANSLAMLQRQPADAVS